MQGLPSNDLNLALLPPIPHHKIAPTDSGFPVLVFSSSCFIIFQLSVPYLYSRPTSNAYFGNVGLTYLYTFKASVQLLHLLNFQGYILSLLW